VFPGAFALSPAPAEHADHDAAVLSRPQIARSGRQRVGAVALVAIDGRFFVSWNTVEARACFQQSGEIESGRTRLSAFSGQLFVMNAFSPFARDTSD